MKTKSAIILLSFLAYFTLNAQVLELPTRSASALNGDQFVSLVTSMSLTNRENEIYNQLMLGNVPEFMRALVPVTNTETINGIAYTFTYYVTPDYLAIGSDDNYFLCPMTPILAQRIANATHTTMPTKKMVDKIWAAATVHLSPSTIPPSGDMVSIPIMAQHNATVWSQRQALLATYPLGNLVGGHKKDVIISNRIYGNPPPGRVVIYGWHYTNGTNIQPVYAGHEELYADYSHGIRLVQNNMLLNGNQTTVQDVLTSSTLHALLSDEGVIAVPNYPDGSPAVPKPLSFAILNDGEGQLKIHVAPAADVTHYLVQTSADGLSFSQAEVYPKDAVLLSGFATDDIVYMKIAAKTATKTSPYSEVLAAVPSADKAAVLIVNGFDRATAANSYDYVRQHGEAVVDNGYAFVSCTNDAVLNQLVDLNDYALVDYILGEESTVDETFSNQEQSIVANYLKQGGNLFVSGSEIAWDLDEKGSSSDKSFFNNYLKAAYKNDSPNGQNGVHYTVQPTTSSIFTGLGTIGFDNGDQGIYNVVYPDDLTPVGGASACLQYANLANSCAGINYSGTFQGGEKPAKLIYLGVPFETFYPKEARKNMMHYILQYFDLQATLPEVSSARDDYKIYPNPFKDVVYVDFGLENEDGLLKIYDLSGKKVYSHTLSENSSINLGFLSKGVYLCKLQTRHKIRLQKIIKN